MQATTFPRDAEATKERLLLAAADSETGALPPRLLLGSDAYNLAHTALTARLAHIESQHTLTISTDADDYANTAAGGLEGLRR